MSNLHRVTRRRFLKWSSAAALTATLPALPPPAAAALPVAAAGASADAPRRPAVVSFHIDRPYLDTTGMAEPYLPPRGTRSGQRLAELSELELRSRYGYF
jgi:hypothetical protein